jgi:hypothetical protein
MNDLDFDDLDIHEEPSRGAADGADLTGTTTYSDVCTCLSNCCKTTRFCSY